MKETEKQILENATRLIRMMQSISEAKHDLFLHMYTEHSLLLLDGELDEILIIAERTLDKLKDIK